MRLIAIHFLHFFFIFPGFELVSEKPSCTRECICPFSETNNSQDTLEQFRRTMEVLRLDKRNLTSFQRRLISIYDGRISAKSMGIVAIILLISLVSLVVVPDLYSLFKFGRRNLDSMNSTKC